MFARSLYHHFDRRLDLLPVVFSDFYRMEHSRLFHEGKLDHAFGPEDLTTMSRLYRCEGRNADGNGQEAAVFFEQER